MQNRRNNPIPIPAQGRAKLLAGHDLVVRGEGGGKSGGGGGRTPKEETDTLSSMQLVKLKDALSEGEIEGWGKPQYERCIALNGTPMEDEAGNKVFKDYDIFFLPGSNSQTYLPGFDVEGSPTQVSIALVKVAPWTLTLNETEYDAVRITLRFPRLQEIVADGKTKGDITGTTVEVQFKIKERSDLPGSTYVTVISDKITGKASEPYLRSYKIELTQRTGPFSIQVHRITPDSTKKNTLSNESYIEGYSLLTYGKLRHPNTAIVGFSIDARQFSNVPSRAYYIKGLIVRVPMNYNPVTRTYATTGAGTTNGTWNGDFKWAWTDNPAWCAYDLATNPRYGLGNYLSDLGISKAALYVIAQECDVMVPDGKGGTEPRFRCSLYLQKREDAMKVLSDMASIWRGMLYYASGVLEPTQDKIKTPQFLFSPANVVDGQFVYSGTGRRARHTAAVVMFNDQENYGKATPVGFEDPDAVNKYGYNPLNLTAFGCDSRMAARRLGKWSVLSEALLTDAIAFKTGAEGFRARPGMVMKIMNPFRSGADFSGRIVERTVSSLTLDRSITVLAGKSYYVSWTYFDTAEADTTRRNKLITRLISNGAGTTSTLTFAGVAGAVVPDAGTLWQLSILNELEPELFTILSVTPEDNATVSIAGIQYNESLFATVDYDTLLDVPPTSILKNPANVLPPGVVTVREVVVPNDAKKMVRNLHISWVASADKFVRGYVVAYRVNNGNWRSLPETVRDIDLKDVGPGSYDFSVVTLNTFGHQSKAVLASFVVTNTLPVPKSHVTGLELTGQGNDTNFHQRDAKFSWRLNSPALAAGQNGNTAAGGSYDPYFVAFEVQIWRMAVGAVGEMMVWREVTTDPRYTFTLEKNREANKPGAALPTFRIEVRALDTFDSPDDKPAKLTVSNPAPAAPTTFSVTSSFRSAFLKWQNPNEADLAGILIYQGTSNVFANAALIATKSPDTTAATISGLDSGGSGYFFFLRCVDTFGSLSAPTAGALTVPGGVAAADIDSFGIDASRIFSNTVVIQGDAWSNNVPIVGNITWNAHQLFYRGREYAIAAGDSKTADGTMRYVYWTYPTTIPPTGIIPSTYSAAVTKPELSNKVYMIALNEGGAAIIVWRSIANAVIGSANIVDAAIVRAKIADAAIDSAKIESLDAGKVTFGEMSGDRISAESIRVSHLVVGSNTDNLIRNPSFESDLDNWKIVQVTGTGYALPTRSAAQRVDGSFSMMLGAGANATTGLAVGHRAISVTPGEKYVVRVRARAEVPAANGFYMRMFQSATDPVGGFIDMSQVVTGTASQPNLTATTVQTVPPVTAVMSGRPLAAIWTLYEAIYTVPAGTYWVGLAFYQWQTGINFYFDLVEFRKQFTGGDISADSILTNTIRSTNFADNTLGWEVNRAGTAQFNEVLIRNGAFFLTNSAPTFKNDYDGSDLLSRTYTDLDSLSVRANAPAGKRIRFTQNKEVTSTSQLWPWHPSFHGGLTGVDASGNTIPGREGIGPADFVGYVQSGSGQSTAWHACVVSGLGDIYLGQEAVLLTTWTPVDRGTWPQVEAPYLYKVSGTRGTNGYTIAADSTDALATLMKSTDGITYAAYTNGASVVMNAGDNVYFYATRGTGYKDSAKTRFSNTTSSVPNTTGGGGGGGGTRVEP